MAFVLFIAGLGAPIPEDIPLIYGVMAGAGDNVYIHFGVSIVFILVGICLYAIGRRLSRTLDKPSRWQKVLSPERKKG